MSLREAGKQKRRDAILAAAEDLIREHGGVGFSMRDLAKRAGVSFVTPFNLFGSKGGIIETLFEERLEAHRRRLMPEPAEDADPIDRVFELARVGCRVYTSDAALHRPLLRSLPAVVTRDDGELLALATSLWRLALRDAERDGMLESERNLDLLARTLHVGFRGSLSLWAAESIGARELERQAEYIVGMCLLGVVARKHRERVLDHVRAIEAKSTGRRRAS